MTYEEVIKVLRFVLDPREYPNGEKSKCYQYNLGAINKAIKALEKQIPKKPIGDLHSVSHYRCPICYSSVKTYEKECGDRFCRWCGQRLLWEAEE